jgi:outer membrane protein OmpA-like peptidoglycan-associated protein
MNTFVHKYTQAGKPLLAATVAALILAGCASAPVSPPGAAEARAKLSQLQADPNLGSRVPVAIREAEAAVKLAEQPVGRDTDLGAHRVLMADRTIEIAKARAETRYAEDQRGRLAEERASSRLDARTREADRARSDADAARVAAAGAAADSEREAARLRRQIEELEARETERGLVVTLGDILFETAKSDLKSGATANLGRLVTFLNEYPNRNVIIEGHTDSVGSAEYNQALSQRRADAVRSWLTQQGISSRRLTATGKGLHQPVADNSSATGRQMNRRVEVIIENEPVATTTR